MLAHLPSQMLLCFCKLTVFFDIFSSTLLYSGFSVFTLSYTSPVHGLIQQVSNIAVVHISMILQHLDWEKNIHRQKAQQKHGH